jgi:hypothetical protein
MEREMARRETNRVLSLRGYPSCWVTAPARRDIVRLPVADHPRGLVGCRKPFLLCVCLCEQDANAIRRGVVRVYDTTKDGTTGKIYFHKKKTAVNIYTHGPQPHGAHGQRPVRPQGTALNKIGTQKWNDQLLSLGPKKSSPELTHPKINLVY